MKCFRCQRGVGPGTGHLDYRCFDCDLVFCHSCIMAHCNEMSAQDAWSAGTQLECGRCGASETVDCGQAEWVAQQVRKFTHLHRTCQPKHNLGADVLSQQAGPKVIS